jgi:CRISPR-associated protein Cas2
VELKKVFILVSYDIPDDKRRDRICKTLKDYGERVQYSVFECLLNKEVLGRMVERLLKIIKEEEDSLRIYHLCNSCHKKIHLYGLGKVTEDEEVYII